jgi:hypothetical protein
VACALASRLSLIFLIGLILAQALSFGAQYYERYESSKNTMLGNLETTSRPRSPSSTACPPTSARPGSATVPGQLRLSAE